jgi:RNA polymerase sigma-70 factor, ECF subfamily
MSSLPEEPAPSSRDPESPAAGTDGGGRTSAPRPIPMPSVNLRKVPASNSREFRAKEAEEDRGLIARAQNGDMAAFRGLVERHQRRAFAIALSLVRDENDANELVQEAFLRVFRGLGAFQGGSAFFTWLYRIITNLSIDLMRKPSRHAAEALGELDLSRLETDEAQEAEFPFLSRVDGGDPADVVRRREIASRLREALDALPSYHRAVIVMREIEGFSYEEMAQAMGVSKGTIMSRLFHARQKLQKALADCYAEQIGTEGEPQADSSPSAKDQGADEEGRHI